ncbi:nucleoside hydrolase [Sinorhizobium medicae]|uniref:Nucleoside hydrolase n=5 Tax=Sinorhizobium medicae TaxID=110321 RepID=A0A6G1WJR8_9HYPH|nr:nucleoside hydrolase [Sinorhizobium medicae]MDX0407791.1 nucleoside hydrolase [Sinorhizobium medicae]MDX0419768.1 nucleoside hydrolase [Sinorhizobium medicae]MDX0425848.1 nucleoside hydrolase [Sinorhizobium medicae]MDX0431762.1 nucleoside hydrolase [Sinorhizobium medicae]MDX0438647.1 nucleoside hydrolase [Sinorhizobium medicae]
MERIILDVDSAGDDILAILFSAGCADIKLEGVTTVAGAAGGIEQVTNVVLNTLTLAGRNDIPVAAGAYRPIVGNAKADMEAPVHFEKQLQARFGDRLQGFNPPAPEPACKAMGKHAIDFIVDTVRANPGEVSIVATGPQTNVALALQMAPDIARLVKQIVVLGGCFQTPGNMTPVSEYNIWADPEAARVVLRSGAPVILVPLDVCEDNRVAASMLTRDDLNDLASLYPASKAVSYVCETFPIYIDIWREFFELVGFPLDDAIAVVAVLHPEFFEMTEPLFVDVALSERLVRGQTVAFQGRQILPFSGPKTTRVCRNLDGRKFLSLFKNSIGSLS